MGAEPAPSLRDRFGWIERGIALASLGAAVAYVALRSASILFYGRLGVTPEELGLGELDLLVRSLGLLVVVFVVVAAVATAAAWLAVALMALGIWDRMIQPLIDGLVHAPGWFQAIVNLAGIATLVVGVWRQNPLEFVPLVVYPGGGLVSYLIWGRTQERSPVDLRSEARTQRTRLTSLYRSIWRPAVAVTVILSLVVVSVIVTSTANYAASAVRRGEAYREWTVPWRADPAMVRWLTPRADDPLAGRCLMYLGQANAVAVFYDADSNQIVRVPSSEMILLVDTVAPSCSRS